MRSRIRLRGLREDLLGHNDTKTPLVDTHVVDKAAARVRNPLDALAAS